MATQISTCTARSRSMDAESHAGRQLLAIAGLFAASILNIAYFVVFSLA